MTTMGEFKQLLEGPPAAGQAGRPDLAAIRRNGRRLRWRRRAGTGTLAAVCSLAIAVPVGAQVASDGGAEPSSVPAGATDCEQDPEPTVEPTARLKVELKDERGATSDDPTDCEQDPEPTDPPQCGAWLCLSDGQPAEAVAAVIDTGDRMFDVPVLLFAERERIVDPQSGDTVTAATLKAGFRDPDTGELVSGRWSLVPGYPFPDQLPLPIDYDRVGESWIAMGAVTDPAAASVVAIHPEGYPIPVELSDREVAPGIRVFWASGSMPQGDLMGLDVRVLDATGETLVACTVGKCGVTG
jgi:hypothetical protein